MKKRQRLIDELEGISLSAERTKKEINAALSHASEPPKKDASIHPTATVDKGKWGIAWARQEETARAALSTEISERAVRVDGFSID